MLNTRHDQYTKDMWGKNGKEKKKQVLVFTFNDSGPLQAKTTSPSLQLHALQGNITSGSFLMAPEGPNGI